MSNAPTRSARTHALKVSGLPCPSCKTPIVIDPMVLLSAASIECAACGLELKINTEKSAGSLNALRAYMAGFSRVRTDFEQKVNDVTGQSAGSRQTQPRRRGRRVPKRTPRRGQ